MIRDTLFDHNANRLKAKMRSFILSVRTRVMKRHYWKDKEAEAFNHMDQMTPLLRLRMSFDRLKYISRISYSTQLIYTDTADKIK